MTNLIDQNRRSHPNLHMDVFSDGIFSKLIYKDLFNCGTVCKDWSKAITKVMNSSEIVFGML